MLEYFQVDKNMIFSNKLYNFLNYLDKHYKSSWKFLATAVYGPWELPHDQ